MLEINSCHHFSDMQIFTRGFVLQKKIVLHLSITHQQDRVPGFGLRLGLDFGKRSYSFVDIPRTRRYRYGQNYTEQRHHFSMDKIRSPSSDNKNIHI